MKNYIIKGVAFIFMAGNIVACSGNGKEEEKEQDKAEKHAETHGREGEDHQKDGHADEGSGEVHLSNLKFTSLGIRIDTLPKRPLSEVIYANGQLEVPPQHEAMVTAILGGNVTTIKVIEGDQVKKGQVLAYLSHPNLTKVQAEYIKAYNKSLYLAGEYQRQKRLNEEKIGSGQKYEEVQWQYNAIKAEVQSYEAQLTQLNLNIANIRNGNIYDKIPVVTPIDGFIEKVCIQLGQYVSPATGMFTVVNTQHIHADLMVFEKDVARVKKGQKVQFTVESAGEDPLTAKIYSVGKQFEQNPKAVHVHAEIDQKEAYLIPGLYINGKIHAKGNSVKALPEEAVIKEEGKPYIFTVSKHNQNGEIEWVFKPLEIRTGITDDGWVEIKLLEPLPQETPVAWNGAYYLISEMKKSQNSHSH